MKRRMSSRRRRRRRRRRELTERIFVKIVLYMKIMQCLQAASSVHYTTSCKHSLVLLRMSEIIARNMLS